MNNTVAISPSFSDRMWQGVLRFCLKGKHSRKLVKNYRQGIEMSIEGIRFNLYPTDNTTERKLYIERSLVEKSSLLALEKRVRGKQALIYDIGANCGMYSLFLARASGTGSEVHAFEPSPVMAERLTHNVQLNEQQVKLRQVALGSERGTAYLNVHSRNHGQSSLLKLDRSTESVEVPQVPLSDIFAGRDNFDCFVIKIDVEGREDDVLHPFLSSCAPAQLPDAILIETDLADRWQLDLPGLLAQKKYSVVFEGDGNSLFVLG